MALLNLARIIVPVLLLPYGYTMADWLYAVYDPVVTFFGVTDGEIYCGRMKMFGKRG